MITAKDQFTMEREMIAEMQFLLNNSNLSPDELDDVVDRLNDPITEGEYDELKKQLTNRQISDLDRLRNGEYVNMGQINQAVRRAANHD